jgi:hypothetical protein
MLALLAAGAGLLWPAGGSPRGGGPYPFTTLYGETVQISGQGLYAHDTLFTDAAARGTDIVTLFLGLPLLAFSFGRYRRGSLRGGLLLAGALAYILYYGASRGLATAYNNLFLVYVALFSASFFAFALVMTAFDLAALPARISPRLPRRALAVFMFVAGLGTAFIWLSDAAAALLAGQTPAALGSHTTVVTYTLDVGIIAPAALLAGVLLLRRAPLGFLLAAVLTIMLAQVGVMVIFQTIVQLQAGIQFSTGELIGMIGSWIVMGGIAIWFTAACLRSLDEKSPLTGAREEGKGMKGKR